LPIHTVEGPIRHIVHDGTAVEVTRRRCEPEAYKRRRVRHGVHDLPQAENTIETVVCPQSNIPTGRDERV
jgi:hypothetical protein